MKSNSLTAIQDVGQAEQAEAWLLRLPQLPPADLPDQREIEDTVAALSQPANPSWILARVASLLLPYYEKDTPQAVREMEAEDWLESLADMPQWAIDRAVRWWKGPDNPDRRKRPIEGDIAGRAKMHWGNMRAVPAIIDRKRNPSRYLPKPEVKREYPTPERAAEIMREIGFKPRTFGANSLGD